VAMAHSVPQSCGLVIETPGGSVVFTGDFKLGGSSSSSPRTDTATLAEWGNRGVLALLSDSTNIEQAGFMGDEERVRPAFEEIFERSAGRVLVSCFATAIARIALVAEVAIQHGRKVAFLGRRMVENVESAIDLGLLSIPKEALVSGAGVADLPRSQVALFVSGSQGEPMSALSLISAGAQRDIRVEPGDRVVFAARIIPGNERPVSRLIGNLYRQGCDVDHAGTALVHVSGHGCREDARAMLHLIRPRHFIPVHGEYRMLAQHARLALAEGYPPDRVHLIEDGQALALTPTTAERLEHIPTGRVLLDRAGLEEIADEVVQDRRHISCEGIVVPIVVVDREHGEPLSQPEIVTRGLVNGDEALQRDSRQLVISIFGGRTPEERNDLALTRERLRSELRRLFKRRTGRRPMVIPVIMEV
jgi:ribonuclease J